MAGCGCGLGKVKRKRKKRGLKGVLSRGANRVSARFGCGVGVKRWRRIWAVTQDGVVVNTFSSQLAADEYARLTAKKWGC